MNLLVDQDPPASTEARDKLRDQAGRFLIAVSQHSEIAQALAARGYGAREQTEGLHRLRDATPFGEDATEASMKALHAWIWVQHFRALEAGMKRSHLITLGVALRRVRVVPEQSGIVLKGARPRTP